MIKQITFLAVIVSVLTILYPFVVYFTIGYLQPWVVASILLALFLVRWVLTRGSRNCNYLILFLSLAFYCFIAWHNNIISLRFYPVIVNLVLFFIFLLSLFNPPTVIEMLARKQYPNLPEEGVCYTRKVCKVWCFFFVINGSIAMVTALWGSLAVWSLYNGFISYVLIGLLMGIEYWVRINQEYYER
jgi:uncharacterized membrane protein